MGQKVGFIEDDDGMAALRRLQGIKGGANGGCHGSSGGWLLAEDVEDVAIQTGGDRSGAAEAEEGITIDINGIEKGPHRGGFAGANLTGEDADAMF